MNRLSVESKGRRRTDVGFSLIELVVVVAVLGVLAAIAVPSFLGARSRAEDASVQADLLNAKKAVVAFGVDHDGDAPASVDGAGTARYEGARIDLAPYGWTRGSSTADLVFSRGTEGAWCVLGTSTTGAVFAVTTSGPVVRSAACPV